MRANLVLPTDVMDGCADGYTERTMLYERFGQRNAGYGSLEPPVARSARGKRDNLKVDR